MKMKTGPKLWKLLSIAVLLIGISVDACFAETQQPPPANRGPSVAWYPARYKCLDLLELERVEVNPQTPLIVNLLPITVL
jgi:hypothetical protein